MIAQVGMVVTLLSPDTLTPKETMSILLHLLTLALCYN